MSVIVWLILSFVAGILLGALYFSGLWLTVQRMPQSATAGLWLLGSFVLRTALVLVGFFLVADGQWERTIACLIGFVFARFIAIRVYGDIKLLESTDSIGK